jgi:hypothetical protein
MLHRASVLARDNTSTKVATATVSSDWLAASGNSGQRLMFVPVEMLQAN